MNYKFLRKKYPKFVYDSCSWRTSKGSLEMSFKFSANPGIIFNPKIVVKNINNNLLKRVGDSEINNFVFNIGMIEMISYWKATCSPKIEIKAGYLKNDQIKWWKDLIIKGMGQYFYENKINWKESGFLSILNSSKSFHKYYYGKLKNRYLIPFAGGRDSIVTLENIKKQKKEIFLFTVNPIDKIQKAAKVSGIKKQITIERKIDRKLLDLNKKGYLNGHTPFTALLSFLSVFCAVIFDCKNVVFSNEKSADEGNVVYLGREINHQWAKSSEFEKMFKVYCKKYLAKDINYFSYLRKHTELEISEMLTKYPKYFSVFSSCNAGMKMSSKGALEAKERWCGKCPKCLFVYISLYPFLKEKDLFKIFGKDLFDDKNLLLLFKKLMGEKGIKPFECVGTRKETIKALKLSLKKNGQKLPFLLNYFKSLNKKS